MATNVLIFFVQACHFDLYTDITFVHDLCGGTFWKTAYLWGNYWFWSHILRSQVSAERKIKQTVTHFFHLCMDLFENVLKGKLDKLDLRAANVDKSCLPWSETSDLHEMVDCLCTCVCVCMWNVHSWRITSMHFYLYWRTHCILWVGWALDRWPLCGSALSGLRGGCSSEGESKQRGHKAKYTVLGGTGKPNWAPDPGRFEL